MKKNTLTVLMFSAMLTFTGLTSCGGGDAQKEDTTTETKAEEQTVESTEETTNGTTEETNEEEATENETDYSEGKKVFDMICLACHQANGEGIPGAFPPLANSDYLAADKTRAIEQVLNGSEGDIVVNGTTFNGVMPPQKDALNDQQISDVLNYVSHSWGNNGDTFTPEEVAAARK